MLVAAYIAAYKGHKEDLKDVFQNSRNENFQDTKKNYMGSQKAATSTFYPWPMVTNFKSQNFGHTILVTNFGHKSFVTKH